MRATKAIDFFQREIDSAKQILVFINSKLYNK